MSWLGCPRIFKIYAGGRKIFHRFFFHRKMDIFFNHSIQALQQLLTTIINFPPTGSLRAFGDAVVAVVVAFFPVRFFYPSFSWRAALPLLFLPLFFWFLLHVYSVRGFWYFLCFFRDTFWENA